LEFWRGQWFGLEPDAQRGKGGCFRCRYGRDQQSRPGLGAACRDQQLVSTARAGFDAGTGPDHPANPDRHQHEPEQQHDNIATAPIGTLIATVTVTMSDGSAFAGSYTVGANGNGNTYAIVSGSNLITTVTPIPDFGTGINEYFPVHATQNGSTIYKMYVCDPT
jgi:hypothetical protein